MTEIQKRLEEIRAAIDAESISYGEIAELQDLAEHIKPGDVHSSSGPACPSSSPALRPLEQRTRTKGRRLEEGVSRSRSGAGPGESTPLQKLAEGRRQAAASLTDAEVELWVGIIEAIEQGVPIVHIATDSGLSRVTIYRMLHRQARIDLVEQLAEFDAEQEAMYQEAMYELEAVEEAEAEWAAQE